MYGKHLEFFILVYRNFSDYSQVGGSYIKEARPKKETNLGVAQARLEP